jgi:plasmid maintenance system killer protein
LADLKRFIHPMSTGSALDGFWAMKVTAQWRLVFRTDGSGFCRDIDYRNYH